MSPPKTVLLLVLFAAGCGLSGGYGDANRAAVQPLLNSTDSIAVNDVSDTRYCFQDSCPFGGDGTLTIYEITVEADRQELLDAAALAYPDAKIEFSQCLDPEADCQAENTVSIAEPPVSVYYNNDGTGQILVDVGPRP